MAHVTGRGLPKMEAHEDVPRFKDLPHPDRGKGILDIPAEEDVESSAPSPIPTADIGVEAVLSAAATELAQTFHDTTPTHAIGDECALHVLGPLLVDPQIAQKIDALQEDTGASLYQLTVGFLRLLFHNDRIAPMVKHFLEDAPVSAPMGAPSRATVRAKEVPCEYCHVTYQPQRIGQRFCCNACGQLAAGAIPLHPHTEDCPIYQAFMQTTQASAS